jgi:hypothetical protein
MRDRAVDMISMSFRFQSCAMHVVLFLACSGCDRRSSEAADGGQLPLLMSTQAAVDDTLSRLLVSRQRALFALLADRERSGLAQYLEPDFLWGAPSIEAVEIRTGRVVRREAPVPPTGYFAILGGFVPLGLEELPTHFEVQLFSDHAAGVTAGNVLSRACILTSWRRGSHGWRAVRMTPFPCPQTFGRTPFARAAPRNNR